MVKKKLEEKHIDIQFLSLFVSVIAFLLLASFSGDIIWLKDFQFFITLISGVFAIFIGVLALLRYYTQKSDTNFLFLGAGFLGVGILDVLQLVTELKQFQELFASSDAPVYTLESVIPKVFLAILLLVSWIVSRKGMKEEKRRKIVEIRLMTLISLIFILFVSVFIFLVIRGAVVENLAIVVAGLGSLLLYILSLLGYLFNKGWQYDDFYYWIIFTLTFLILSQIFYLPFLNLEFPNMINLSVWARFFAYTGLLIGFLNSIYEMYQREKDIQRELEDKNLLINQTKAKVEEAYLTLREEKWNLVKKRGTTDKILRSIVKGN